MSFFKEYASKEFVDEIYLRKNKVNTIIHDFITLRDITTGCTYYAYIENGIWTTSCKTKEIKVTKLPDKMKYVKGEVLDTTGMIIATILENGNEITIDNSDITIENANILSADTNVIISYIDNVSGIEYSVTINGGFEVTEFDPTIWLIDFEYTTNDDGTYTITGWKQTLNGEPSTELIVPDNSLIII